MVTRNRFRDLLGKGAELLEQVSVQLPSSVAGDLTRYATLGPWDVDMDVQDVVVNSAVPVTAGTNTLDVFNNSITANPVITQFDPEDVVAATPLVKSVTGNRRITAGNSLYVRLVVQNADPTEDVSVTVRLERVLHEPDAKVTSYGGYPKG